MSRIAQINYCDPQSAGINLQSPQSDSTPWTLTLQLTHFTLSFYQIEPYKKGPFLVLPSSIARNSLAPNGKKIFRSTEGFLRAALAGHDPPGPLWKIAKMALFNPCMEFENFLSQMSSFDALWKCRLGFFSQKCPKLRPCAFLSG